MWASAFPLSRYMRRLLNKPWLVATLALAAVALIGVQSFSLAGARPVAMPEDTAELETVMDADTQGRNAALFALFSTYSPADHLRDPFMVPVKPARDLVRAEAAPLPMEAFRLSAVWVQGTSALAVLNNRICSPGETVGQLTLESVNATGAWVVHARGREFVHVGQEILIAPATQPLPSAPLLARGES